MNFEEFLPKNGEKEQSKKLLTQETLSYNHKKEMGLV